jgi:tRNA (cmo5U34)-methyltransferase
MHDELPAWQRQDLAKLFLEGVRSGIPLAAEQIDALLRIVRQVLPRVERLLDVGCGDGILGRAVMAEQPNARGVFLDFSDPMLEAARKKADPRRATFVVQDLAARNWAQAVRDQAPFDLVVSGLAIHHLPDQRKRELYQDIFDLLRPGGLFLHLEHVAPHSQWAKEAFDEMFVDCLWSHHRQQGGAKTREEVAAQWYNRPDKSDNILAPLDLQCQWLEEIGFRDVDCFLKIFQLALFGGCKPN